MQDFLHIHHAISTAPLKISAMMGWLLDEINGQNKNEALSTGFLDFDESFGGLKLGTVSILASRPSMGKTTLAFNIAEHLALGLDVPVLIFSMEMSSCLVSKKLACQVAGVEVYKVTKRKLDGNETRNLNNAISKLNSAPLYIDETFGLTAVEIVERTRELVRHQRDLRLVVIDGMYLPGDLTEEDKSMAIRNALKTLKALALEERLAVLLSSGLNRNLEQREDKRPLFQDAPNPELIRGSDMFMTLYRDEVYNVEASGEAELFIMRNRYGPTGLVLLKTDLLRCGRFKNYDWQSIGS